MIKSLIISSFSLKQAISNQSNAFKAAPIDQLITENDNTFPI
jgi:hypothetical protein